MSRYHGEQRFELCIVDVYRERTRAFIKIQEGCNSFAHTVIILMPRPVRSRDQDNICGNTFEIYDMK